LLNHHGGLVSDFGASRNTSGWGGHNFFCSTRSSCQLLIYFHCVIGELFVKVKQTVMRDVCASIVVSEICKNSTRGMGKGLI